MTTLLALDPGLETTGWALLEKRCVQETGSLRTTKDYTTEQRIERQILMIGELVSVHSPQTVAVELYEYQGPGRSHNATGLTICRIIGAAQAFAMNDDCKFVGITRNEWARALGLGMSKAKPAEIRRLVERLLNVKPANEHETDACAIAFIASGRVLEGRS